jgi:hypothetical protein
MERLGVPLAQPIEIPRPLRTRSRLDDGAYYWPLPAADRQALGDIAQQNLPMRLAAIIWPPLDTLDPNDCCARHERVAMDANKPIGKLFLQDHQ